MLFRWRLSSPFCHTSLERRVQSSAARALPRRLHRARGLQRPRPPAQPRRRRRRPLPSTRRRASHGSCRRIAARSSRERCGVTRLPVGPPSRDADRRPAPSTGTRHASRRQHLACASWSQVLAGTMPQDHIASQGLPRSPLPTVPLGSGLAPRAAASLSRVDLMTWPTWHAIS